jgi:hypothetical protein
LGLSNFVSLITVKKTGGMAKASSCRQTATILLWYGRDTEDIDEVPTVFPAKGIVRRSGRVRFGRIELLQGMESPADISDD